MQFTESPTPGHPDPCILICLLSTHAKLPCVDRSMPPVRRPHLWQTGVAMPVNVTAARAKAGFLQCRKVVQRKGISEECGWGQARSCPGFLVLLPTFNMEATGRHTQVFRAIGPELYKGADRTAKTLRAHEEINGKRGNTNLFHST